ncbi:hypothetical protein DFP93_101365 [Aneurinibacillus soli]|uniref:Uncharacterized protein n=1 Tax=Aneurinibacillus soli TaxID=1500254 RepID=A0A0U5B4F5_9BACL|nr:hypothetical protein DFP93_101365 [Aneurinibacillus soli]BAU28287.1 hypothetical protein CB4_02461 [Aneurinibacillus soli]
MDVYHFNGNKLKICSKIKIVNKEVGIQKVFYVVLKKTIK